METEFLIKTGEFKGPLEVLLELVEKKKMHINDISLSEVADTFIEHMNSHAEFPISDSADFILIASTLLLIKSKSLLPNLELSEEEEGNILDLEKRLELYKKYKEIGSIIKEIFAEKPLYFANEKKVRKIIFSPPKEVEINMSGILASIQEVLKNAPQVEVLPKISVKKIISLEEMIESLRGRIEKSIKMSFKKDFAQKDKNDKITVIVSFLAMLELVKQGVVRVNQHEHFSDIEIESESVSLPKYQ